MGSPDATMRQRVKERRAYLTLAWKRQLQGVRKVADLEDSGIPLTSEDLLESHRSHSIKVTLSRRRGRLEDGRFAAERPVPWSAAAEVVAGAPSNPIPPRTGPDVV
jgi:hypothetical protein